MYHHFILAEKLPDDFSKYLEFISDPRAILVDDALVRYLDDALRWVPTYNPFRAENHQGLCHYGVTVIREEGAKILSVQLECWIKLFETAPTTLILTGDWTVPAQDDLENNPEGYYQKIELQRDEAISIFRKIESYCREVIIHQGRYYVLHLGI